LEFLNKEYEFDLTKAKSFDYVLKWFEREEVEVYYPWFWWKYNEMVKFSHSSYSDGFSYALNTNELCDRIFCNLLMELSENEDVDARGLVGYALVNNFDKLPELAVDLLTKLSKDKYAPVRWEVADVVADNFDKLLGLAVELLTKLSENADAYVRRRTAYAIANNFDKLPFDKLPELTVGLLTKLSKDVDIDVRGIIEYAIANNFDKLPFELQNLLERH